MGIDACEFGRIVVDGQAHEADLILFRDHVEAGWWRRQGHELAPEDLGQVLAAQPEVLVVGTGHYGRMRVLPQTTVLLQERGIRLIVDRTAAACRIYNQLLSEGVAAVAALHLTC